MRIKFAIIFLFLTVNLFAQNTPVYDLSNFLNIRSASAPQFSNDEREVYFRTSITGTSQIWKISDSGGWPDQVTFFDSRVSSFSVCPNEDIIAFTRDEGGNEQFQIYFLHLDDNRIERITTRDDCRYGFSFWSETSPYLYYTSNERNRRYTDIYRYNYKSRESEIVYQSDFSNYPQSISPDDKFLIISRSHSNFNNDLLIYDLETKSEKVVLSSEEGDEDNSVSGNTLWLRDSKGFFLTSNMNRDFRNIALYLIENGSFRYIDEIPEYAYMVNPSTLNHDYSIRDISKNGKYLAYVINIRGEFSLRVVDLHTKEFLTVPEKLNRSIISTFRFAHNSERAVLNFNTPVENSDVWVLGLSDNNLKRLTYSSLGGINPEIFVEPVLMSTNSFDGLNISGFLYLPKNHDGSKLPVIIDIHGGPEGQSVASFNSIVQYFVNQGFAVFDPNVRGSTGFGKTFASLDNVELRENSVKDIIAFVDMLDSAGIIDMENVIVKGGSYGGYMVLACMTLYPDIFAGGINIVGISNFITFLENTADYRRKNREAEYGSLENDREFLKQISPIRRIENIKAPLMLIHGVNDPRVPVGEADQVYERVKAMGIKVEYLRYDDEGHGLSKLSNRLDAYPKMVEFIRSIVGRNNN